MSDQASDAMIQLPGVRIRESTRAKHVRFKMTVSDGLIVVVPKGFDRRRIPGLLLEKAAWIEAASARIGVHRKAIEGSSVRPERIVFRAIDRTWEIVWRPSSSQGIAITETDGSRLVLSGDVGDPQLWRPALRRWVIGQGRAHLVPWLHELAGPVGVEVKRTSIRCQRTRWGSYSSRGTVSLNAQLLFLPRELARYVLHHELCHAAHPDHSAEFWKRLARFEPDARQLRARMRDGWTYVPGWLSRSMSDAA